jgi:hypothetical protein
MAEERMSPAQINLIRALEAGLGERQPSLTPDQFLWVLKQMKAGRANIKELRLYSDCFTAEVEAQLDFLEWNTTLRSLTLGPGMAHMQGADIIMNYIPPHLGKSGVLNLVKGLRVNRTLTYLNLSDTNIQPISWSFLSYGLLHNASITTLILNKNRAREGSTSAARLFAAALGTMIV